MCKDIIVDSVFNGIGRAYVIVKEKEKNMC
jgi:hypothetical protein